MWASGAANEPYVGCWSRWVARGFVAWLAVPLVARWLDVGCGTGALSATILAHAAAREVNGADPSAGYVAYAGERARDPRLCFAVGDARALPYAAGAFDAAVSGLVLNFVPGPERAVAEMTRVARAGGIVAAYVWDYAGRMELMRRGHRPRPGGARPRRAAPVPPLPPGPAGRSLPKSRPGRRGGAGH